MEKTYYILFFHVLGFYILTSFKYGQLFCKEDPRHLIKSRMLLYLAVSSHTALLFLIAYMNRHCPVSTPGEGLLFCAWMVALGHLTSEFFAKSRPMGIFTLLPITFAVLIALILMEPYSVPPEHYRGPYFSFHIVVSLAAYGCFTIAAILGFMYVLLVKKLKAKQFDVFFRMLPPLENIELLMSVWVYFGGAFMSIAAVIGRLWVIDSSSQGMSPREWGIFAVLGLFLGAISGRQFFSLKGYRFAVSVLAGFVLLLMTQLLQVHGF